MNEIGYLLEIRNCTISRVSNPSVWFPNEAHLEIWKLIIISKKAKHIEHQSSNCLFSDIQSRHRNKNHFSGGNREWLVKGFHHKVLKAPLVKAKWLLNHQAEISGLFCHSEFYVKSILENLEVLNLCTVFAILEAVNFIILPLW